MIIINTPADAMFWLADKEPIDKQMIDSSIKATASKSMILVYPEIK